MCTTRTILGELLQGEETRVWPDQCRQVCVNFWRVGTDLRGADAVDAAAWPNLIHVRYFVACLDDPNRVPPLICSDGTSSETRPAGMGEAGHPPAWPRPPKLRRGITRDLILGSHILYGELPTTTTASQQTRQQRRSVLRGAVGSCSWTMIGNRLAPQGDDAELPATNCWFFDTVHLSLRRATTEFVVFS